MSAIRSRNPVVSGAIVSPYRFSDHPVAMIAFYELLGLDVLIRQGDFAILEGRSGRIAVHPLATAGSADEITTSLVLEVSGAADAAIRLAAAGLPAHWWDESFGRQAVVEGPVGTVSLNGTLEDPYGHEVRTPRPRDVGPGVDVVATVRTDDLDEAEAFFGLLGFGAGRDATPDWRPLRSGPLSGIIGLMPDRSWPKRPGASATTEIGIETTEPLDTLFDRLDLAGHPASWERKSGPTHLVVVDPDGESLEVYPAPPVAG